MTRQEVLESIRQHRWIENADLSGIDLSGADLAGGRFEFVSFRGADLSGVNIVKTGLKNATFPLRVSTTLICRRST